MHRFTVSVIALTVFGCSTANTGRTNGGSNAGTTGGSNAGTTGGTNSGTTGGTNSGTTGGTNSSGGDDGGTDPNCGVQNFTLQKGLPPDLLIVLDKSGSMSDSPSSGGASKWDQVTGAINTTVMQLQGQIKWGLEMFPHDNDCGVTTSVDVPIANNDAAAIASAIAGQMPNGSTPTTAAIQAGTQYLSTVTDSNPKYILLATDGEPNCAAAMTGGACMCPSGTTAQGANCCVFGSVCFPCSTLSAAGGDDTAGAEAAVTAAATAGVHTFVVGIATDPGATTTVLNTMATNGGEAQAGATKYYAITNQADLVTAINTIAGQIISCSFALQMAPSNPDFVSIEVNRATVPNDTTQMNGWDYGPADMSIQFYGSWCTMLQAGNVTDVQAIFECGPVS